MTEINIQNVDANAEAGVLSCLMQEPRLLKEYENNIRNEYFYSAKNKMLFSAIAEIIKKDGKFDLIKLSSLLQKTGDYETVGGPGYINQIFDFVMSTDNFNYYLQAIIELAAKRRFVLLAEEKTQGLKQGSAEMDQVFIEIKKEMGEYDETIQQLKQEQVTVESVLLNMMKEAAENNGALPNRNVATGLTELDNIGFLTRRKLTIVGARPSHAKTSLVIAIIIYLITHGKKVICITSEWTKEDFIISIIRQSQNIDNHEAISNFVDRALSLDSTLYSALNNIIVEDMTYSKVDMLQKFYKNHNKQKCDVLIIDQLTNIKDETAGKNLLRTYEIEQMLNELEKLTQEEQISTLILSQLNRECEKRDFPLPSSDDFRDSGAYEQKANVLGTLMRAEKYYYERKGRKGFDSKLEEIAKMYGCDDMCSNLLLFNACKARNNETGMIPLFFETPGTGIRDWKSNDQSITYWNKEEIVI